MKIILSIFFSIILFQSVLISSDYKNFNYDWKFAKGNHDKAEQINFDDSDWQQVKLPHDWAIYGPFDPNGNPETAKLPWKGEGWYRKVFNVDKSLMGKKIHFLFDGVMAFPKVYINGKLAYEWDYGYNSFYFDATEFIKFGENNIISVYVDTRNHESRWYPGAGIYRKVQMVVTEQIHANIWGTFISTPLANKENADVRAFTKISNDSDSEKLILLESNLITPEGEELLIVKDTAKFIGEYEFEQWFRFQSPKLWDTENPNSYLLKSIVKLDGKAIDTVITKFGIRSFEFTSDDGIHLNGKRVKLKGVCLHQDLGPLGAAFNKRAMQRELEILKEMGINAVRTSHNVPAPELLDICDEMGILVIDEAFDKWDKKGDLLTDKDFSEWSHRNIKNFITRDRNHPSIFLWSIGNEMWDIGANKHGSFNKLVDMIGNFRRYDPTRKLTTVDADVESVKWHFYQLTDVHSWNYGRRYEPARKADPSKPVIITESASTVSTRGYYSFPLPKVKDEFYLNDSQVSSYDMNAPFWAEPAEQDFKWQEEDKFVAGEFVWTGFDYLGEPTPYNYFLTEKGIITSDQTARSSYFGIVDLCGIPKDRYYIYRSYWRPDVKTIHILPHWNWEGKEGEIIPVHVHTNADKGELFLNGKSLGMTHKQPNSEDIFERYRLMWNDVKYEPGELKVVVYKNGEYYGEEVMKTADEPYSIRLTPDRTNISADGEDLSYILIEALDKNGNLCPLAENEIKIELNGNAEIAGVGNGNPQSLESFQSNKVKLFYGKAMLIVKSLRNKNGEIDVTASSDNLKNCNVHLITN
ncbi:MAG: glycoside hydrolase family 2 protein [Ignavibacteriales bacterium]|nr:glycoside hydrolase family 2 protein [Ignavibacteriales bacterium]